MGEMSYFCSPTQCAMDIDKLPKEHEASYTYTKGNAVGLPNLSKLWRKIEHFSGGRISPHYNSRAALIARFHNILYIG